MKEIFIILLLMFIMFGCTTTGTQTAFIIPIQPFVIIAPPTYLAINPITCTGPVVQLQSSVYICNASKESFIWCNEKNSSDCFPGGARASRPREGQNYTFIAMWDKLTPCDYKKLMAHELCHAKQYEENRAGDEIECNLVEQFVRC